MAIDVSKEAIGKFLEGRNPQKYIVAIEATYYSNNVDLIINDPYKGKQIVTDTYKPFIWMRYDAGAILYGGDRIKTRSELNKAGIILETLRTKNDNGISPDRVANGYKFILTGKSSYNNLLKFLTDGGADVFGEHKDLFMTLSPVEQYMVQTGKRLFKGFDDYNDVHRLQFDIETTGLDPKVNSTFLIGIKDNRGFEEVIRVSGDTPRELRESEIKATQYFLKLVKELEPDIISGYNSEVFDFNFLNKRCERLGYEMKDFGGTLNDDKPIYFRKNATIKLGAETEYYDQTIMWGFNVIDIAHAVRKAQAINSSIKGWGLKYITKFSDVAKPNRVYIQGDSIHKVAADIGNDYAFNETDGSWYRISEERPIKDGYSVVKGSFIVDRYLLDDLWETEKIDYIYNQASFLLSKLLPTSFSKTSTMGTASIWKLIMIAWSYENHLAIPLTDKKRDFTGGLSRLLEVGFAETVAKLDYAALYPNTQLTNNISPDVDITNAMLNMLLYIAECRDEFKELKNVNGKLAETETDKDLKYKYESLKSLYDKKQLPLKILANSFFGSFGAPYLFNWGDTDCAEETTCRGRQYLRLMIKFFTDRGFRGLVLDTDGVNFSLPSSYEKVKYISTGEHRFNIAGKEYTGLDAILAEFNDVHMKGRMGLDVDEIAKATINFARKNYADLLIDKKGKTKVKLVGNTIKSKKMPGYIEDFLDKAVVMLLDNNGYDFVELYYNTVNNIYTYQIPVSKIASKARIKQTVEAYKLKSFQKNKNGKPLPKQAHMELIMRDNIPVNLGDTVYYVNTGAGKSHGDLQSKKNKETGKTELILNCKLISNEQLENNPDLTTDEYNVPKYLTAFNKRIKPLLVCFHPDVRDSIMIDIVKDKKTKQSVLQDRQYFTKKQLLLCAGLPFKPEDQDTYEDLMRMEDKEIYFWLRVEPKGLVPNDIEPEEFKILKDDYIRRMIDKRNDDSIKEAKIFDNVLKTLEVGELAKISNLGILPDRIKNIVEPRLVSEDVHLFSLRLKEDSILGFNDVDYGDMNDLLFKYEDIAIKRDEYYKTLDLSKINLNEVSLYDIWLAYAGETLDLGLDISILDEPKEKDESDDEDEESDE